MQNTNKIKKTPEQFMIQVTANYSDDASQGLERRFVVDTGMTYDDFMMNCDKVWQTARYTFGVDKFDELTIPKKDQAEVTIDASK